MTKPLSEYHKQSAKKDGLCPICRACSSVSWYKNREANLARIREYTETTHGRAIHLVKNAKRRAKDAGLKFSLDKERIEKVLIDGKCERTGIAFQFDSHKRFRNNPFAPSIDKIDPFGDYTHDNIKVVCFAYNIGKNQFSHAEFVEFCRRVVEFNS